MHTWLWARAAVLLCMPQVEYMQAWPLHGCPLTANQQAMQPLHAGSSLPCHATLFYQLFYRDSNPYLNAEQAELYSTHKFPLGGIWNKFVKEANTVWFVLWKNYKG